MRSQVTIDDTVDFLNELIKLDRPAIASLIANRVPCNEYMADHPTVQCSSQHGGYHVGMLGILNGLFGVHEGDYRTGWGPITFIFEDGNLLRVEKSILEENQATMV